MCASWPHACMQPSTVLANSSPVSSGIGSASMSPRSSTTGPSPPCEVGDDRRHRVAGAHVEAEPVDRVEHRRLRLRQREPELGRAVDAPAELDQRRAAARSASASSSAGPVRASRAETNSALRRNQARSASRTRPRSARYAPRSASPGRGVGRRARAAAADRRGRARARPRPATNPSASAPSPEPASARVTCVQAAASSISARCDQPRAVEQLRRERDRVAVGPARPPRALRVDDASTTRPAPTRAGGCRAGSTRPRAAPRTAAAASRRAAPPVRAASRGPGATTAMRHSPAPRRELRARGSSPARAWRLCTRPASSYTPSRARSSPRSTIRLSATRVVPSATPNSPHHCTSRAPRIRGRPGPQQQARDQRPGRQRPLEQRVRAIGWHYVLAASVAESVICRAWPRR